ncbi:MBL fold metallo-hydrolase [Pseudodesulfovibrio sp.]|uniref:MBL fold metallo-hydrolase n=1 Tax=unclassified Pseudodesulfovibrio TaxID=2661612 RepID=UPI003B00E780
MIVWPVSRLPPTAGTTSSKIQHPPKSWRTGKAPWASSAWARTSSTGDIPDKTLWTGYVIHAPERKIHLSGDTGYGPRFSMIAEKFGTFDLVTLDGGQ